MKTFLPLSFDFPTSLNNQIIIIHELIENSDNLNHSPSMFLFCVGIVKTLPCRPTILINFLRSDGESFIAVCVPHCTLYVLRLDVCLSVIWGADSQRLASQSGWHSAPETISITPHFSRLIHCVWLGGGDTALGIWEWTARSFFRDVDVSFRFRVLSTTNERMEMRMIEDGVELSNSCD